VESDVVFGPVLAKLLAAGRQLADEVSELAVVGVAAGRRAKVATTSRAMRSQSR
jgi:3-polyprenyl-4-hydroxybenzoate decarboxylase